MLSALLPSLPLLGYAQNGSLRKRAASAFRRVAAGKVQNAAYRAIGDDGNFAAGRCRSEAAARFSIVTGAKAIALYKDNTAHLNVGREDRQPFASMVTATRLDMAAAPGMVILTRTIGRNETYLTKYACLR